MAGVLEERRTLARAGGDRGVHQKLGDRRKASLTSTLIAASLGWVLDGFDTMV